MKKIFLYSIILIFSFKSNEVKSQYIMEFGIKPTEFILKNFETYYAFGKKNKRFGIFLSYRPSTQNSGEIQTMGSGSMGGYGKNFINHFYNSYTFGLYQKIYNRKGYFYEADLFYRNWYFKDKYAEFDDWFYNFEGRRTENVNVFGLKLLAGKTLFLTKKEVKFKPYIDVYIGGSIRYTDEVYETFNGYVEHTYYDYLYEHNKGWMPSYQGGIKIGFIFIKK